MKKKRKEHKELSTIITRRTLMLGAGQAVLGGILVARLYELQISQNASYQRLSDRNQFNQRLVLAPRGRLFDVKGRLLAGNSEVFELLMVLPLYKHDQIIYEVFASYFCPALNDNNHYHL